MKAKNDEVAHLNSLIDDLRAGGVEKDREIEALRAEIADMKAKGRGALDELAAAKDRIAELTHQGPPKTLDKLAPLDEAKSWPSMEADAERAAAVDQANPNS